MYYITIIIIIVVRIKTRMYIYIFSCTYINMGCSMLHFYEPAVLKSDGPP